jgi:hypothetical protein
MRPASHAVRSAFNTPAERIRKMAGILYAMWRDEQSYDPQKAAKAMPA